MLDLILDVVLWLFVIWLVMKVIEKYLVAKNEILAEQLEDLTKQLKEQVIQVDIEKHGSVFYLFEKDTNRFIAQGTNFDELRDHCVTRFKDKSVVANEDQMKQLGLK